MESRAGRAWIDPYLDGHLAPSETDHLEPFLLNDTTIRNLLPAQNAFRSFLERALSSVEIPTGFEVRIRARLAALSAEERMQEAGAWVGCMGASMMAPTSISNRLGAVHRPCNFSQRSTVFSSRCIRGRRMSVPGLRSRRRSRSGSRRWNGGWGEGMRLLNPTDTTVPCVNGLLARTIFFLWGVELFL
jgi:hypothetical protein